MTSDLEALKTNEILRRRKLRIQQVREQSKDIAKKIRQRANIEKFKQLESLDANKEKEYLEQQDKLIKKLEQLHAKSLGHLGAGHKNAAEATQQEKKVEKVDLSKQRGREATVELRREKQEKLDERKKLLDRKLQAREIANEISREKSSTVINKLSNALVKSSEETETQQTNKPEVVCVQKLTSELPDHEKDKEVVTNDMATQWDFASPNNDWELDIPPLTLKGARTKESISKTPENHRSPETLEKSGRNKRPNLFALSEDMPPSLCGGRSAVSNDAPSVIPSLTLVSDYIQNRDLRLRNFDPRPSKRSSEDLKKLKQTILQSRVARAEGSIINPVHVADVHMVPVPSWHAEINSQPPSRNIVHNRVKAESIQFESITNSEINCIFSSIRRKPEMVPTPVLRGFSPFRRNKVSPGSFSAQPAKSDKPAKLDSLEHTLGKKSSVTMYNHSTRDVRDMPCTGRKLVLRDHQADEDAYSQAMKEASSVQAAKDKEHQKKLQDMRNKIAMTKQSVEKEYKDTMDFLKSLPNDNTKPIKNAYKDTYQEQARLERQQRKLQHEYKKIKKECKKQAHGTLKSSSKTFARRRSSDNEDDFYANDLQYSWMPVPESDKGLAVHIIPTKIKEQKSSGVKFSKIDSYHEYRSRHKHTPPTKDTSVNERENVIEAEVIEEHNSVTSTSTLTALSEDDSQLGEEKQRKNSISNKNSDAERIIIYRILDLKSKRRPKVKKKPANQNVAKQLSFVNKENIDIGSAPKNTKKEVEIIQDSSDSLRTAEDTNISPRHLKEGIYKTVSKKGDNISSLYFTADEEKQNTCQAKTDTVKRTPKHSGDQPGMNAERLGSPPILYDNSSSSFKTATYVKGDKFRQQRQIRVEEAEQLSGSYVKIVDPNGQDSGKFYIGATGLLKDDAYEVVIKLRKTDTTEVATKDQTTGDPKSNSPVTVEPEKTHASCEANTNVINKMTTNTGVGDQEINITDLNTKPTTELYKQENLVDKGLDAPYKDSSTHTQLNTQHPTHNTQQHLKTGNSVSVQTSFDSPETRYHRMSSSTSTTYMSPPEVILPQYLKDDYNERIQYTSHYARNPKVYTLHHESHSYPKRTSLKSSHIRTTKYSQGDNCAKTPPNTARSSVAEYTPCSKKINSAITVPKRNEKRKRKCEKRIKTKICLKPQVGKAKRTSSTNIVIPSPPIIHTNPPNSRTGELGVGKNDLNPLIKRYIDQLLHMNKEGVKALNIANQECSSVTTPGSSVIDDLNNNDKRLPKIEPTISFEQLKQLLAVHIHKKYRQHLQDYKNQGTTGDTGLKANCVRKASQTFPKKRSVHKVKSLNISRSVLSNKSLTRQRLTTNAQSSSCPVSGTSSSRDDYQKPMSDISTKWRHRSKSTPSPRRPDSEGKIKYKNNSFEEGIIEKRSAIEDILKSMPEIPNNIKSRNNLNEMESQGQKPTVSSNNYEVSTDYAQKLQPRQPLHTSTQTSRNIDEQIGYITMAEDKIQNMEKIADLTEKCTQRLTNLAKVLEEVRKNKMSYNHTSSTSDTDQVSEENCDSRVSSTAYLPVIEIKERKTFSPPPSEPILTIIATPVYSDIEGDNTSNTKKHSPKLKRSNSPVFITNTFNIRAPNGLRTEHRTLKIRGKGLTPPASIRRCIKRKQEFVVPHELSTVVEVETPVSTKYKNSSVQLNVDKYENPIVFDKEPKCDENAPVSKKPVNYNPDLLDNKENHNQVEYLDEDSKLQMMDLQQFNDIMLKPFISIQEYAKQCQMTKLEEGSNIETLLRGDVITDELSSLHSDGSLPDVIAELLKRNIISEPFKFDTASNVNSATASSDSTLSVLALSNAKKGIKKLNNTISNKNNMEETSDSLSVSSNPDLENAFKKLGMGWASSTLKKTKEHLAFSSSSTNDSSSSLSQYKLKTIQTKEFPVIVTDSMSSIRNVPNAIGGNEPKVSKNSVPDCTKSASQQTSTPNSLTVKQFLTKELAKRITFSNKSRTNDTEEEFVSLCDTKMPDEMQLASKHGERSIDSNPRARTSTPVQLFKSMAYHSSSSSNGLFSNADDLSSVKGTSNSMRNQSTSEKDDLTIPNFSLRTKKGLTSDCSKSED